VSRTRRPRGGDLGGRGGQAGGGTGPVLAMRRGSDGRERRGGLPAAPPAGLLRAQGFAPAAEEGRHEGVFAGSRGCQGRQGQGHGQRDVVALGTGCQGAAVGGVRLVHEHRGLHQAPQLGISRPVLELDGEAVAQRAPRPIAAGQRLLVPGARAPVAVAPRRPLSDAERRDLLSTLKEARDPVEPPRGWAPPPPAGPGNFVWPLVGPVNSSFGPRGTRLHAGIDIGSPRAQQVAAAADGTLLAFRRSDNSFHGHKSFVGERRVIQFNWVTDAGVVARERLRHRVSAWFKGLGLGGGYA